MTTKYQVRRHEAKMPSNVRCDVGLTAQANELTASPQQLMERKSRIVVGTLEAAYYNEDETDSL